MKTTLSLLLAIVTVATIPLAGWQARISAQVIEPAVANSYSLDPSISGDGQLVAFASHAANLVPNDTNGTWDIFVHDLQTGETSRISVTSAGEEGNAASMEPAISQDGRFVAFHSRATNLVPNDTNGTWDIFVHDLLTGETERVSVTSEGGEWEDASLKPAISGDGRFVAFESWVDNASIFVRDRFAGETMLVSLDSAGQPDHGPCFSPSVSADGRVVSFFCYSQETVPYDGYQVRTYDMETGVTSIVSVPTAEPGTEMHGVAPSISADGSVVAFESYAPDLAPGEDDGFKPDIFVRNRLAGETDRVSFSSQTGSEVPGGSFTPSISGDGRYVAFHSQSPLFSVDDLNDTWDILVHDRSTGQTEVISLDDTTHSGNGASIRPSLNADGRFIAFASKATDLTADTDTNGTWDIFVRDLQTGETTLVSVPAS